MKISYNWLKEYLPADEAFKTFLDGVEKVGDILTSVGLEVEAIEPFESVPGSLSGLVVAEVLTCEKHPDADKLKVTTVNNGTEVFQVVCGAPNVTAGQKVILAIPGTTLYPGKGDPFTIKKAKIRGIESVGMICAEDEIGVGESHDGIIILPQEAQAGTPASEIFPVYTDYLIEIGLTPNRMDAQSHLGVAKDICAWLTHRTGSKASVISPLGRPFSPDNLSVHFDVVVQDPSLAPRYSGIGITNLTIQESPAWMQNKLRTIGLKPINNIVDITNFILHATGQPLHAFDADEIRDNKVIVETLPSGTPFVTLDGKERKLNIEDIMICDGKDTPMCIAGVFGGAQSGVSEKTKNIFLESAVFDSIHTRKSMIRHDLRTDAATRFEKGVDISKTVEVLKYAALLIRELCGGQISSDVIDIYKRPAERLVKLEYNYLNKLSGKMFQPLETEHILESLGFEIRESSDEYLLVRVPESNPDISIPADIVEEILRISGLDNIPIHRQVKMAPGLHDNSKEFLFREKITSWLTGNGFSEIFTNSITSDKYFEDASDAVHILNSLSEDLTILRKGMLPTALEAIEYNLNRQSKDILFFEFGKTYSGSEGVYKEADHLCIYCTGEYIRKSWNTSSKSVDLFYVKGIAEGFFTMAGIIAETRAEENGRITFLVNGKEIGFTESVEGKTLQQFGIKQPVMYLDLNWNMLERTASRNKTVYRPVSKFPVVSRDLSMILDNQVAYGDIEKLVSSLRIKRLSDVKMFDLYQSDKLGAGKKSIALSFLFTDDQKTLTDKETDKMIQQITKALEDRYHAEIRSHA